jgi:hypothetical protein
VAGPITKIARLIPMIEAAILNLDPQILALEASIGVLRARFFILEESTFHRQPSIFIPRLSFQRNDARESRNPSLMLQSGLLDHRWRGKTRFGI